MVLILCLVQNMSICSFAHCLAVHPERLKECADILACHRYSVRSRKQDRVCVAPYA